MWGNVTSCSYWVEEGTGVLADPNLGAALHSAPIQQAGSAVRILTDILTSDSPVLAR